MNTPNNPQAFPGPWSGVSEGMSLRDYFAGQAVPAAMAVLHDVSMRRPDMFGDDDLPQAVASLSYRMADAMLAARGGKGGVA